MHPQIESYGNNIVRSGHTAGAILGFASWNEKEYIYSITQINKGNNPNSNLEVVSMLNINRISNLSFHYHNTNSPSKYNPRLLLGTIISSASQWQKDLLNGKDTTYSDWPESYFSFNFLNELERFSFLSRL